MSNYAAASRTYKTTSRNTLADPTNTELTAAATKATTTVETVFKGQPLRSILLQPIFWNH